MLAGQDLDFGGLKVIFGRREFGGQVSKVDNEAGLAGFDC